MRTALLDLMAWARGGQEEFTEEALEFPGEQKLDDARADWEEHMRSTKAVKAVSSQSSQVVTIEVLKRGSLQRFWREIEMKLPKKSWKRGKKVWWGGHGSHTKDSGLYSNKMGKALRLKVWAALYRD